MLYLMGPDGPVNQGYANFNKRPLRASDTRGGLEGLDGCWLKWSY